MTSEIVLKYCPTTEFVVCPRDQIQFFVTFHHFTNATTMKKPNEPPQLPLINLIVVLIVLAAVR